MELLANNANDKLNHEIGSWKVANALAGIVSAWSALLGTGMSDAWLAVRDA